MTEAHECEVRRLECRITSKPPFTKRVSLSCKLLEVYCPTLRTAPIKAELARVYERISLPYTPPKRRAPVKKPPVKRAPPKPKPRPYEPPVKLTPKLKPRVKTVKRRAPPRRKIRCADPHWWGLYVHWLTNRARRSGIDLSTIDYEAETDRCLSYTEALQDARERWFPRTEEEWAEQYMAELQHGAAIPA